MVAYGRLHSECEFISLKNFSLLICWPFVFLVFRIENYYICIRNGLGIKLGSRHDYQDRCCSSVQCLNSAYFADGESQWHCLTLKIHIINSVKLPMSLPCPRYLLIVSKYNLITDWWQTFMHKYWLMLNRSVGFDITISGWSWLGETEWRIYASVRQPIFGSDNGLSPDRKPLPEPMPSYC